MLCDKHKQQGQKPVNISQNKQEAKHTGNTLYWPCKLMECSNFSIHLFPQRLHHLCFFHSQPIQSVSFSVV